MSTTQPQSTDTSARQEQYLAAELDYVTTNFPISSPRFRRKLRRIATLTLFAVVENSQDPQQTYAGKLVDLLLLTTIAEWPEVSFEQFGHFVSWYIETAKQFDFSESDLQFLLEL